MKPKDALNLLKDYNAWRRGKPTKMNIINMEPLKIGIAIDVAIRSLRKQIKSTKGIR